MGRGEYKLSLGFRLRGEKGTESEREIEIIRERERRTEIKL